MRHWEISSGPSKLSIFLSPFSSSLKNVYQSVASDSDDVGRINLHLLKYIKIVNHRNSGTLFFITNVACGS